MTGADVEAIVASMSGYALASLEQPTEVYKAGLNSTRLLMALGDLLIGWLLARQAEVALDALDQGAGRDEAFYQGKVATARFFAETGGTPFCAALRRLRRLLFILVSS